MDSVLLTTQDCAVAWKIVLPAVKEAAQCNLTNKLAGTIVVLDPATYSTGSSVRNQLLFQADVDPDHESAHLYATIACAKAELSLRTGRSSRDIQQNAPHLYRRPLNDAAGDIKWGGSVVREGLIVAFSGVQAVYDEWIAGMMADLLIAMCRDEMTQPYGIMTSENSYVTR